MSTLSLSVLNLFFILFRPQSTAEERADAAAEFNAGITIEIARRDILRYQQLVMDHRGGEIWTQPIMTYSMTPVHMYDVDTEDMEAERARIAEQQEVHIASFWRLEAERYCEEEKDLPYQVRDERIRRRLDYAEAEFTEKLRMRYTAGATFSRPIMPPRPARLELLQGSVSRFPPMDHLEYADSLMSEDMLQLVIWVSLLINKGPVEQEFLIQAIKARHNEQVFELKIELTEIMDRYAGLQKELPWPQMKRIIQRHRDAWWAKLKSWQFNRNDPFRPSTSQQPRATRRAVLPTPLRPGTPLPDLPADFDPNTQAFPTRIPDPIETFPTPITTRTIRITNPRDHAHPIKPTTRPREPQQPLPCPPHQQARRTTSAPTPPAPSQTTTTSPTRSTPLPPFPPPQPTHPTQPPLTPLTEPTPTPSNPKPSAPSRRVDKGKAPMEEEEVPLAKA